MILKNISNINAKHRVVLIYSFDLYSFFAYIKLNPILNYINTIL